MRTSAILFVFCSLLISGHVSAQDNPFRNKEKVKRILTGLWESKDYVYNPQQTFVGTKEERALYDKNVKTLNEIMPILKMKFLTGGKLEAEMIFHESFNLPNKKMKGKWRLEEDGDVLIIEYKDGEPEQQKIIFIDDKVMETLVSDGDFKMIIHWDKK